MDVKIDQDHKGHGDYGSYLPFLAELGVSCGAILGVS